MDSILTSFRGLFDTHVTGVAKVIIPQIQRAYAQGRSDKRASRTRERFLNSIHDKLTADMELTLDFVYGKIEQDEVGNPALIPLDGQQRLTTLFLLYWYIAKHEGILEENYQFLHSFTYHTRYSARDFCAKLISFTPDFSLSTSLKEQIEDQNWFPLDWNNDSTVKSMMTMIDAIHEHFKKTGGLWSRLDKIRFYYQSIDSLGQTDDVYIKMNSRGKPLTNFEHFKAELLKRIKAWEELNSSNKISNEVSRKIDGLWTDILWPFRENSIVDDSFLRYFRFVCDIICYRSNGSPRNIDEFELLKEYFPTAEDNARREIPLSDEEFSANFERNITTLIDFFDCWAKKDGGVYSKEELDEFFRTIFSPIHEPGKVKTDFGNLFADALRSYANTQDESLSRTFKFPQLILLYAFVLFRQSNDMTYEEFACRLRRVNNLILNSSDEISDSVSRDGGNRLPGIILQVDGIILKDIVSANLTIAGKSANNFNAYQIKEEIKKQQHINVNPEDAEKVYQLEDHEFLYGQIWVIGTENIHLSDRFISLFSNCDKDRIDCALLSQGFYYQRDNDWRIQMGSSGANTRDTACWKNLFHYSSRVSNDRTRDCLISLLNQSESFDNDVLEDIIAKFLIDCETANHYDWRYYYIKYPSFRVGRYGKYTLVEDAPYEIVSIHAKYEESSNSKKLFLNELLNGTGVDVDREQNGQCITRDKYIIYCDNVSYYVTDSRGNEVHTIYVPMNDGVDTVNRVELARERLMYYIVCT